LFTFEFDTLVAGFSFKAYDYGDENPRNADYEWLAIDTFDNGRTYSPRNEYYFINYFDVENYFSEGYEACTSVASYEIDTLSNSNFIKSFDLYYLSVIGYDATSGPSDRNLALSNFCYDIIVCEPTVSECVDPTAGNGTTSSFWCDLLEDTTEFNDLLSSISQESEEFFEITFQNAHHILCDNNQNRLKKELLTAYLNIYSNQLFSEYELDQLCCIDDNEETDEETHGNQGAQISCSLLDSNSSIQSVIDEAEAALFQEPQEETLDIIVNTLATINSASAPGSETCPSLCDPQE